MPQPREARIAGLGSARVVGFGAAAQGIVPPPVVTVSQWAASTRQVAAESGSPFPGPWSNDVAPYLVEVMDELSLSSPSRRVVLKKSHQVAGTEAGLNATGCIIDRTPAPCLVVLPNDGEMKKFNRVKLQPMIDKTDSLREKVAGVKSRDERASTVSFKPFRGGFLQVTSGNTSAGLKMISVRFVHLSEVSEYPLDVDQQGDPVALAEKRTTAYSGREKIFYESTPDLAGSCRISKLYEASDQRRFYVPCPHCGDFQALLWERLAKDDPAKAVYSCAGCGADVAHHHKRRMIARGVWIKTWPGEDRPPAVIRAEDVARHRARSSAGRQPGFAVNALYSPFLSWAAVVEDYLKAKDTPSRLKDFVRQMLGEPYEAQGEAPPHEKLLAARTSFAWRRVPKGALFLTSGVDVQGNRLEWDVYAWGVGLTGWHIDSGVIAGDPTDAGPWRELGMLLDRTYEDQWGKPWRIDLMGVDSGFLSNQVYRFARRLAATGRVLALDGRDGWRLPPIGTPSTKDIDFEGKKIGAVQLWPVGTYDLKSELYGALTKLVEGPDKVTGAWPIGVLHFTDAGPADEEFFRQLTAEYLRDLVDRSGSATRIWVKDGSRRNERHDIAVYARALARHLSDALTPEHWQSLAASRGARPEDVQGDLARLWSGFEAGIPATVPDSGSSPAPPAGSPARRTGLRIRTIGRLN